MTVRSRARLFLLTLLTLVACSSRQAKDAIPAPSSPANATPAEARGAPDAAPEFVLPYPRGRWRLASRARLENVVLWVSHILIRHAGARNDVVSFNVGEWTSVLPPPERTRVEALELAREIAQRAARNPGEFGDLARAYSEDLTTRDEGGALGGVAAIDLEHWPQVLDALAVLRAGEVSEVIETRYGFHVLLRSAPPPERTLSGAHLVIGHDRAEWLQTAARGPLPRRSREEAAALADRIYRAALAEPGRFPELVQQYSEHADAVLGGDFGSWSTHDSNAYPGRMLRLERLEPGAVAPPIDTPLGFEIIQRTPERARATYAADVIGIAFDPEAASAAPSSRDAALTLAEQAARALARAPADFDAVARGLGTQPEPMQPWREGRAHPTLTAQLSTLAPGDVLGVPVEIPSAFLIVRRSAPPPPSEPARALELPAPAVPEIGHHMGYMPAGAARAVLRSAASAAGAELALEPAVAERLLALHDVREGFDDSSSAQERWTLYRDIDRQTRALLGDDRYPRYESLLQRACESALLQGPLEPRHVRGL